MLLARKGVIFTADDPSGDLSCKSQAFRATRSTLCTSIIGRPLITRTPLAISPPRASVQAIFRLSYVPGTMKFVISDPKNTPW